MPRAYLFWLLAIHFQASHVLLHFYDFWAAMCMLGNQEGVRCVSHLLETWRALESGPRYLCSGCRVGGWGPLSLGQCPSLLAEVADGYPPLIVRCFLFIILTKSNIIFQAIEIFPMTDFFWGFSWVGPIGYLKLYGVPQSMRGTSSYSGVMRGISSYSGYLEFCRSYFKYLELYGVPQFMWCTSSYSEVMRDTSNHAGYL